MPDFIVVGSDGTEHHFPDGMDPQRAVQVVRNTELATANAKPLNEPTTYDEGRKQSIAKTMSDTGLGILKGVTSMFSREPDKTPEQINAEVKANPPSFDPMGAGRRIIKGLKSTASNLTTPEGGGEAIGNLVTLGAMGRATDAVSKIPTNKADLGRAMQTVGDFKINKPLEMIKKAGQQLEESQANVPPAGVDRYKPNTSGVPDRGLPQEEMPTSTPPVELESALDSLLRKNTEGASSESTQTDRVPYGGVEVPHKVRRPRMAKEVENPFGKDVEGGSIEVGDRTAPLESADSASPAGGDVVPVPNTKPKLSADEVAAVGRRLYGSRDAGAMLYGNSLSPAERAEAIKRMAPGPSRLPLTAEARINGQPRDLSLEEALKNLIIESKGKPQ